MKKQEKIGLFFSPSAFIATTYFKTKIKYLHPKTMGSESQ